MGGVIFLVVMLLIAWLVVILPQQRRVRAHQALVSRLEVGDEVMTTAGILGTITAFDDDEVLRLAIAPELEVRMVKGAIARRLGPDRVPVDEVSDDDEVTSADSVVDAAEE